MKTIASNTRASIKLQTLLDTKFKHPTVYPCYENECSQIDMIYIDNGSKECFTLDREQSNDPEGKVWFPNGEMKLYYSGAFLETLN